MASLDTNGDTGDGDSCSSGWRDRKQGGDGEDRDRDFGGGRGFRSYPNGNGGGDHGEDGAYRGYRRGGGSRGRFNNRRGFSGGHRRPNGFDPSASRFDDDLTPPPPKLDMTPVGNVTTTNVYWETCEKNRAAVKKVPFVFEPPETDFHLEAAGLLRELQEERDKWTVKDLRGNLIGDCRGAHGYDDICQFCDGRRGSWAISTNTKADPVFERYQDSILASMPSETSIGLPSKSKLNTLQLVPLEDPEVVAADFEEMTLGIVADEKITDIV